MFSPYIGYSFDLTSKEINYILKNYSSKKLNFNVKKLSTIKAAKIIANHINNNKIVAVFRGKAEFGPRALCNRSILSNALIKKLKTK